MAPELCGLVATLEISQASPRKSATCYWNSLFVYDIRYEGEDTVCRSKPRKALNRYGLLEALSIALCNVAYMQCHGNVRETRREIRCGLALHAQKKRWAGNAHQCDHRPRLVGDAGRVPVLHRSGWRFCGWRVQSMAPTAVFQRLRSRWQTAPDGWR